MWSGGDGVPASSALPAGGLEATSMLAELGRGREQRAGLAHSLEIRCR